MKDLTAEFRQALEQGNVKRVKALAEQQPALLHSELNQYRSTALQSAIEADSPGLVSLLIGLGIDPNRNYKGWTALHTVQMAGRMRMHRVEIARVLLDAGADPNARSKDGASPLHWAAYKASLPEMIALLLEYGADPNYKSDSEFWYWPPLRSALGQYELASAELLLAAGADPNGSDNKKADTLLHRAAHYNRAELIELLLIAGADPALRNNENKTALDTAIESNAASAVDIPARYTPA